MHQPNPLPDSSHWHPKNRSLALEKEEGGGGAVLPSVLSKTHFDALTTNLERLVVRPHTHDLTYTFRRARVHTHQFGTVPLSGTGLLVTREREMRPVGERDAWKRGKRERDTSRETSAASWNRYRDRPRRKTRERSSSRTTERQKRRVIDRTRQTSDRESRLGILMKQRGGNDRGKERDNTGRKGGRERWQQEEYAPVRARASPVAHDALSSERIWERILQRDEDKKTGSLSTDANTPGRRLVRSNAIIMPDLCTSGRICSRCSRCSSFG